MVPLSLLRFSLFFFFIAMNRAAVKVSRKRNGQNSLVLDEAFDGQALRRSRLSLSYRRLQFQGEVRRCFEKDAQDWLAAPPSPPRTLQTVVQYFLERQSKPCSQSRLESRHK